MDEPSMSVQPSKQDHTSVVHEVEAIQRAAANPEASVWVAASAGTGKTKVLTDRMLHLLVKGVTPERILCLTFTKAAAAEMSNRLLEMSLKELGIPNLNTCLKQIHVVFCQLFTNNHLISTKV